MLTSGALVRADVTGSILGVVHDRSQAVVAGARIVATNVRSEEHTSELQSRLHLVFRLLLEKKNRSVIRTLAGGGVPRNIGAKANAVSGRAALAIRACISYVSLDGQRPRPRMHPVLCARAHH